MIYRLDENNNLICGYSENYPHFQEDWILIETDLLPNDFFHIKNWNVSEWVEGLTESELAEIEAKKLLKEETEMYRKRQCDGVLAYAEISAEFRLAKLSGILTEEQHGAIEDALIPVRNEVLAGQWKSARQKLEEIGVVIGVELYNRLHTQITNYINENYNDVLE